MALLDLEDTIAAVATPPGEGAIGIVRLSGSQALAIGRRCFLQQKPCNWQSHRSYVGFVLNPATNERLDQALCTFMRRPQSYTGEDVVEFSCHGSPAVLRQVLAMLVAQGARLARPGEFTLRAFLNGKLDLAQAEAVMDVVRARTGKGVSFALSQLEGRLSRQLQALRQQVLGLLARLEANIDFSEDDVPAVPSQEVADAIEEALTGLDELLATAQSGALVREGVPAVLVGRPNVGKSSLLNAFLSADRAIVTDIPGTTRDVLEETVDVDGIPLVLADTAGIATTEDAVEKIGVERSRASLAAAHLVILVLDCSMPLQPADHDVITEVKRACAPGSDQFAVVALNKADKAQILQTCDIQQLVNGAVVVRTSAVSREGLAELRAKISDLLLDGKLPSDSAVIASLRHREVLQEAQAALMEARQAAVEQLPEDFACIGLRAAVNALGELTGESATEDLLDRIFAEFCIGK